MTIPTPPGGRNAPGGTTPPGGETPPGGRGAPGDTATPTAPLGRPPRITLRPLKRNGSRKTVTKVTVQPDRVQQLRSAIASRKQQQEQMHKHVQDTMPQIQQKNQPQGQQVPPQQAGMGQKGQAHKEELKQKQEEKKEEHKPPDPKEDILAGIVDENKKVKDLKESAEKLRETPRQTEDEKDQDELTTMQSGLDSEQSSSSPDPEIVQAYQKKIEQLQAKIAARKQGGTP